MCSTKSAETWAKWAFAEERKNSSEALGKTVRVEIPGRHEGRVWRRIRQNWTLQRLRQCTVIVGRISFTI